MTSTNPTKTGLAFEASVRKALGRKGLGLRDVNGGASFVVGGHQVDICGGWDEVLLVVECTQSINPKTSLLNLISEVNGKKSAIRGGFRAREDYASYKDFEWLIVTKNIQYSNSETRLAADNKIHLVDSTTIDYYVDLVKLIEQPNALRNFLGELDITPRDLQMPRLPAFRIQLDKQARGYLFWCEPHDLLEVAYVARRGTGTEDYYQRMLSKSRITSIKKFIDDQGVFPNNVIVSFDEKPQFNIKEQASATWPQWLEFGDLTFPKSYRSCWIVDGQHRLYGFAQGHKNPQAQKLAVVAFEQLPERKQARYFIDINKEQKPVSPDLLWDLEGAMAPETTRGRIALSTKRLNQLEPLKDSILLPLPGIRTKNNALRFSGVCNDINDTGLTQRQFRISKNLTYANPLLIGVSDERIPIRVGDALSDYFGAINEGFSSDLWDGVIKIPGGITVSLYIYQQVLMHLGHRPAKGDLDIYVLAFEEALKNIAPDKQAIAELRSAYFSSYAQRRNIRNIILAGMRERIGDSNFAQSMIGSHDPTAGFGEFERRFAEFIFDKLQIIDLPMLKQKSPQGVWERCETKYNKLLKKDPSAKIHEVLDIGQLQEIIKRRNNASILMPLLKDSAFISDALVEGALDAIREAKSDQSHGRITRHMSLIRGYITEFRRIMASQ